MNTEHHHIHGHSHDSGSFRLSVAIIANVAFVIAEFATGLFWNSTGLVADAGHNLVDVGGLLVTLLAALLMHLPPTKRFSYGFHKGTVLASLANAIMLLLAVAFIIMECVERFLHPVSTPGLSIILVAVLGIIVNGGTTLLLQHGHKEDLNMKGAYLHMLADTLVSVGVAVSGGLILLTNWQWLDPLIGMMIAVIIFMSTIGLLKESVILAMDGVPPGIDLSKLNRELDAIDGVVTIHHLHVWPLGTTRVALTAHVVLQNCNQHDAVQERIRSALKKIGIHHSTIEFETNRIDCRYAPQLEETNCIRQAIPDEAEV